MSRELKKELRSTILEQRNAMTTDEIQQAEAEIISKLKGLLPYLQASHIFCYRSFRSEVPTERIIDHCLQQGKNIYIPVCVTETKEMILSKYDHEVQLVPVSYGLMEPSKESIKISDRNILDLAIVPGAVFDRAGYRIGYGAGYYDKFFAHMDKKIYKIALAYSFQLTEEVPKDEYDVPVDCIITEKEIILCNSNKS